MRVLRNINTADCARQHSCAFIELLHDLGSNMDDDIERDTRETWDEIVTDAEESGDGLDYDGPLLSWEAIN